MCGLRLQHEVSLLQQQLCESRELIHSLQSELQVYDQMCSNTKASKGQCVPCFCSVIFNQLPPSNSALRPSGGGSENYIKQTRVCFYYY